MKFLGQITSTRNDYFDEKFTSIRGQGSITIRDEHAGQFLVFGLRALKSTVFPLTEVISIKLHRALLVHGLHTPAVLKNIFTEIITQ